jgi:polygalacturonase
MTDDNFACTIPSGGMPRRDFLRNSLLVAVPVMLAGAGVPMAASAATYVPPSRQRGSTLRNVRNYGAVGNGTHDDTSAFQSAINSLPSTGGTVYVPAGTYLIDAVRSVKLRSLMHLKLDADAKLVAKPTASESYNVLFGDTVHDLEISGGRIIGERDQHRSTGGEGGHGIRIRGSQRVTIRDIHVSKGWGDGITVGPKPVYKKPYIYSRDVVVANVVCTNNRRNGLSIGNVIGMKVYDSEFSNTNGTSPQCGIDVEPDRGANGTDYNDQVWIQNCRMNGNAAYGMNVWNRARNLTVKNCTIEDNKTCGIVTTGLNGGTFIGNTIRNNMSTGLFIKTGTVDVGVSGNTFYRNYLKQGVVDRADFTLTGVTSKITKDVIVGKGTSNIRIGKNYYK